MSTRDALRAVNARRISNTRAGAYALQMTRTPAWLWASIALAWAAKAKEAR